MTTRKESSKLTHLIPTKTIYKTDYDPSLLETFKNKNPKTQAWTTFICPEFTSLCPITGQPDFATIIINYVADTRMVESKSLKLYLFSYRNHGDFHEECIQKIAHDLFNLMKPHYVEVLGKFSARGGIAIHPFVSLAGPKKYYQDLKESRFQRHCDPGLLGRNSLQD